MMGFVVFPRLVATEKRYPDENLYAEMQEKAKKILDIWTKSNTFPSAVLSPLSALLQQAEEEKGAYALSYWFAKYIFLCNPFVCHTSDSEIVRYELKYGFVRVRTQQCSPISEPAACPAPIGQCRYTVDAARPPEQGCGIQWRSDRVSLLFVLVHPDFHYSFLFSAK